MEIVRLNCPSCGGTLNPDLVRDSKKCSYCGTSFDSEGAVSDDPMDAETKRELETVALRRRLNQMNGDETSVSKLELVALKRRLELIEEWEDSKREKEVELERIRERVRIAERDAKRNLVNHEAMVEFAHLRLEIDESDEFRRTTEDERWNKKITYWIGGLLILVSILFVVF